MFTQHSSQVLQESGKLLGHWTQQSWKKLVWRLASILSYSSRLHLFTVESERERVLSRGTFSYLGWITADKRLINWAKVERDEFHLLWRKGNRIIFTCLHPPPSVPLTNLIPSSKEFLSCVTGGSLEGLSFVWPLFLQSYGIFGWLKKWFGLVFLKKPKPLSSTCQLNLREEPFLTIQFLLMKLPRAWLTSLTTFQMATFQNCCFVTVYDCEKFCPEILFHFHVSSYYGVTF